MKKLTITLAALCMAAFGLFAQEQEQQESWIPKNEFTLNAFGGINLGAAGMSFSSGNHLGTLDSKSYSFPNSTAGFGLGWIHHFSDHWGVITGVDVAMYQFGAQVLDGGGDTGTLYAGRVYDYYSSSGGPYQVARIFTVEHFTEDAILGTIQIPVLAQFTTPIANWLHFYAAAGATLGINIHGTYKQNGTIRMGELVTTDLYPSGGGMYPSVGTDYITGTPVSHDKFTAERSFAKNPIDVKASVELGLRWAITPAIGLYTGVYADYGFLGVFAKKACGLIDGGKYTKEELLDWPATDPSPSGGRNTPDPWDYDTADGSWVPQFNSIFNASGVPDNGYDYETFYLNQNDNPYVGHLSASAAGVKVRLTVGKPRAKRAEKAPRVKPEPAPVVAEPEPEPEPEVVEVPEDIKQTMMELSNTLFAFDKFNLDAKAKAGLDKVAAWLKDNPNLNVEISGHTDGMGSEAYNQRLSENRAKSVYDYFVDHGVSAARLSYKGYGKTRPIATNETDEGRQQNRRVELTIIQ